MAFDINRLRQLSLMQGYGQQPQQQPQSIVGGDELAMEQEPIPPPLDITSIRAGQIPGSQGPPIQLQPPPPQPESGVEAMLARFKPETGARDRYNELMGQMPQREEPSIMRRIVAGGMGLGTKDRPVANPQQTMENVMYAPYMRDIQAWKEQVDPLDKAAQRENTANNINRQVIGNAQTVDAQLKRTESMQKTAEERNRIAEIRALADKARAAKWTVKVVGENVVAYSPDNTQQKILGPSGSLTEADRLDIEGQWRVDAATARGNAAVTNTETAGRGLVTVDGKTYRWDPELEEYVPARGLPSGTPTRPGTPNASTTLSPKEVGEDLQNTYRKVLQHYPEYQKYFTTTQNGSLQLIPRPKPSWNYRPFGGTSWDDVKEWDKVNKLINPNYVPPDERQQGQQGQQQQQPSQRPPGQTYDKPIGPPIVYKYQQDQNNPQNIRRQAANTNVWQVSTDGGRTWK